MNFIQEVERDGATPITLDIFHALANKIERITGKYPVGDRRIRTNPDYFYFLVKVSDGVYEQLVSVEGVERFIGGVV